MVLGNCGDGNTCPIFEMLILAFGLLFRSPFIWHFSCSLVTERISQLFLYDCGWFGSMALWPWSLLYSLVLLVVLSPTWLRYLGSLNTVALSLPFHISMGSRGLKFSPLWSATGLLSFLVFMDDFHGHFFLNALVVMLLSSITEFLCCLTTIFLQCTRFSPSRVSAFCLNSLEK